MTTTKLKGPLSNKSTQSLLFLAAFFFLPPLLLLMMTSFWPTEEANTQPAILGTRQDTPLPTAAGITPTPTLPTAGGPSALISSPLPTPTPNSTFHLYPVVKVVDGDTLAVDIDGKSETLRLIGIDTPETVDPRKSVQCFGQEASNKAHELLDGQMVRLEVDPTQGERDKYGRLLRYVFLKDGTFFNQLMISQGYAFEYTYYSPYKYQAEFQQAERQAREGKRGLWADETCGGNVILPTGIYISPSQAPQTQESTCDCSSNLYNCSDFKTHAKAQSCFESCGGVDNDIHQLDRDHDGNACESLP